jgi:thiamine biosynthesis lipoprotein
MSTVTLSRPGTGLYAIEWPAIGTTVRVVVTSASALEPARQLLVADLDALDRAASRFRPDSEVRRLEGAAGRPVAVSPLLAAALRVALDAAARTDGDVDPTVGATMVELGYDRDFATMPARSQVRVVRRVPGWRRVRLDAQTGEVTLPPQTLLDLGATAKAWAADRAAAAIHDELGCGVLVSLGGDVATAGPAPEGGWIIRVQERPDRPDPGRPHQITLPEGGAVATSSTLGRQWRQGRRLRHHVLDPRTGRPAADYWRTVTVAAARCLDANIASTAAIVRGAAGLDLLRDLRLPARLVAADGGVVLTGSWPTEVAA